jgi:AcrR family transcriptional regulator
METKEKIQERIIEAAAHLFSRKGYHGASTREIAKLADVHETSMFRHFLRKEDLFWAALEFRLGRVRIRKDLQAGLIQGERPEVVIPLIFELIIQIITYEPELVRLLSIGLLELRPATERILRERIGPMVAAINSYLTNSVNQGKLRNLDPLHITATFVCAGLMHQGLYSLLTGGELPYSSTAQAVSAYSSFWLDTLSPAPTDRLPLGGASRDRPRTKVAPGTTPWRKAE